MVYFLSDFHLGAPDYESSLVREKKIVRFLDSIKSNASELYLLGDVFDFWFEYGKAIPKGFVRSQRRRVLYQRRLFEPGVYAREIGDGSTALHYKSRQDFELLPASRLSS